MIVIEIIRYLIKQLSHTSKHLNLFQFVLVHHKDLSLSIQTNRLLLEPTSVIFTKNLNIAKLQNVFESPDRTPTITLDGSTNDRHACSDKYTHVNVSGRTDVIQVLQKFAVETNMTTRSTWTSTLWTSITRKNTGV